MRNYKVYFFLVYKYVIVFIIIMIDKFLVREVFIIDNKGFCNMWLVVVGRYCNINGVLLFWLNLFMLKFCEMYWLMI